MPKPSGAVNQDVPPKAVRRAESPKGGGRNVLSKDSPPKVRGCKKIRSAKASPNKQSAISKSTTRKFRLYLLSVVNKEINSQELLKPNEKVRVRRLVESNQHRLIMVEKKQLERQEAIMVAEQPTVS